MDNQKIKEIRKNLGISQEKLAEMVGVSLSTIQNYENGSIIPKSRIPIFHNIEKQIEIGEISQKNVNGHNINNIGNDKLAIARLHKIIEEKDKQINMLLEIINKFNIK